MVEAQKKAQNPKYTIKSIEDLSANPKNARTHSAKQVKQIAASIKKFGFINPIVTDSKGVIIAGHGRLEGAKQAGLTEIPCILADHLTAAEKKAYMLADNQIALQAEWDEDLLKIALEDLQADDFDLAFTGFDDDDIASIFDVPPDPVEKEDHVPTIEKIKRTKLGEVWLLGEHRLMCGDSTDALAAAALMGEEKADMAVTDPPYNVDYEGKTKDALKIQNDKKSDSDFRLFLSDAFARMFECLKDGGAYYIWHADSEGYNFRGAVKDCGQLVKQCLIWVKSSMVMGRQDYHWMHEPCLYGWKSGAAHNWTSDRKQTTILNFDRPNKNDIHPTMKPVNLIEYQIQNNSVKGEIVLDLFGGSGTTLIAAEKTCRKCYMMELDPHYVDVIITRWQEFTGKKAIRESDGVLFDNLSKKTNNA